MPQLVPLVLELSTETTETYNPASFDGKLASFVDSAPEMVFDARRLDVSVRPAAAGNTGRTSEHLGIRPIPLSQGECCIDVTSPVGNTFRLHTMVHKTSSKAQALELVEMIRAYVALDEFEEVVTASGFY